MSFGSGNDYFIFNWYRLSSKCPQMPLSPVDINQPHIHFIMNLSLDAKRNLVYSSNVKSVRIFSASPPSGIEYIEIISDLSIEIIKSASWEEKTKKVSFTQCTNRPGDWRDDTFQYLVLLSHTGLPMFKYCLDCLDTVPRQCSKNAPSDGAAQAPAPKRRVFLRGF